MMDIGDEKELMAEFAEFKELMRRDLGHAPASEPSIHERSLSDAAIDQGPSPQAPRAEDSWSALHATEEEFDNEPEDAREGGRRALFFAAAAIVIIGLAALTWVLGPWSAVDPNEDQALATAPPLAAPDAAAPVLDSAETQPQDAAPGRQPANASALDESVKPPLEPVEAASTAGAAAPAAESQSETAASAAPAAGVAGMTPMGSSIPVPAGAAVAPKLAPLPTTAAAPSAAPVEPASPPVAVARRLAPPKAVAPEPSQAAAPSAPVSEPPTAAAETTPAPKPAPRVKIAKPKKPTRPVASRPAPAPAQPVAVATPEPAPPPPPPPPASDGPLGFVKRSVNAVGSAIGIVR